MDEIIEKYSNSVIRNLDSVNIKKIILFLESENCDYIEDLLEDYLDLFTIEYEQFIKKYNQLNEKYQYNYLKQAGEDMNLLEEFFN